MFADFRPESSPRVMTSKECFLLCRPKLRAIQHFKCVCTVLRGITDGSSRGEKTKHKDKITARDFQRGGEEKKKKTLVRDRCAVFTARGVGEFVSEASL